MRHLRFRQIKALIATGEIKNTRQVGPGPGPNVYTWIPLDELEEYFSSHGIIANRKT